MHYRPRTKIGPYENFKYKKYSEQLPIISDADCLGFDKESMYSDLGFDKE